MRGFLAGETSGDYLYLLGGSDMYVDADDPEQSSVARFINHSLRRQNCAAADICLPVAVAGGETLRVPLGVVYVKATKPIDAGEEFFTDYVRHVPARGTRARPTQRARSTKRARSSTPRCSLEVQLCAHSTGLHLLG
eukprot:1352132-Prymnesium_polylepis.2